MAFPWAAIILNLLISDDVALCPIEFGANFSWPDSVATYCDLTFTNAMPNSKYTVSFELPWNSTWYVSNKTKNGCRINVNTSGAEGDCVEMYVYWDGITFEN